MELQVLKDLIDDMFDTEQGQEDLANLAEYIETNLNEINPDIQPL